MMKRILNFVNKIDPPSEKYFNTPKIEFERINTSGGPSAMARSKVTGGWLIWSNGGGMCFMPDPNHEWTPEKPKKNGD
jgi:hypothetical protein